jgi:hypothetical protein
MAANAGMTDERATDGRIALNTLAAIGQLSSPCAVMIR